MSLFYKVHIWFWLSISSSRLFQVYWIVAICVYQILNKAKKVSEKYPSTHPAGRDNTEQNATKQDRDIRDLRQETTNLLELPESNFFQLH